MHAVEFLKKTALEIPGVVVLSGGQRHLKQGALTLLRKRIIDDEDTSFTRFAGRDATLQSVADELFTVSMWGDRRLVIVDEADEFVTKFRGGLEKLVEKPAKKSVLILDVTTWPKNTRIYKQVAAKGLDIECSELKGTQLLKWLQETITETYGQTLARDAAVLLIDLIGEDLGLLETELAKLASYVGAKGKIELEDVKSLVGGWRTETTWVMADAAIDDDLASALKGLDQLLGAGEAPMRLLGGISFVFKKFAFATDLSRNRGPLDQALRQAGVYPAGVSKGQIYLRRLGRIKAEQLLQRLVNTDAGLKGASRIPERFQLERLLIELAGREL